jgi:hypothetical protein
MEGKMAQSELEEITTAIRRDAASYIAKVVIATAVGIVGLAGLGLWIYVKQFLPDLVGGVPRGAVLAIDLPGGCPHGWSMFGGGISRTIVGAVEVNTTNVANLDVNEKPLHARPYHLTGGEEKHTLTIAEIPSHDHGIQILQHSEYLRQNTGYPGTDTVGRDAQRNDPKWPVRYTDAVGEGKAYNVMPPFIALYYCRKD